MKTWLAFLIVIGTMFSPVSQKDQGDWIELSAAEISFTFGEQLSFTADLLSQKELQEVYLFLTPLHQDTQVMQVPLEQPERITFNRDLIEFPIRAFSEIEYWYRFIAVDGSQFDSPRFTFFYGDNRFEWQTLSDETFEVFWHNRDMAFGQDTLNVAHSGMESVEKLIPYNSAAPTAETIKIYVYENAKDLQTALKLSPTSSWVAGHASPELNTILISIPSGLDQQLELERQVPHEITHIMQYRFAGDRFNELPIWWIEGTASLAELYPNADYPRVLENAVQTETLLSLQSLTKTFPRDASQAFQAYAESASFTRYLYQNFGKEDVQRLMEKYMDGMGLEEGSQEILGKSLSQVEQDWQQEELKVNIGQLAWKNLGPYLLLFLLIVVPPITIGLRRLTTRTA